MQIKLELLAPAKNIDIGIAAINCGADALYIAGPAFGAREAAGNSIDDIKRLVEYADKYSVKVYLALNTILYDNEINAAERIAQEAYEAGVAALIIQDLGLLKAELPPIPLHASTQTNIRTKEQAMLLESLGFERLILARELSLFQINEIRESVNIDLECFIHGALCVSYSGQCYLSEKIAGRSANRGSCMQACRLKYDLEESNGHKILTNKPILSLKDLNLGSKISELAKSGVSSFKIEGRLKNESYIKNIVRYYRLIIDEFISRNPEYEKSSFGKISGGFTPNPEYTFHRGYTNLNITGERGGWNSGESAKGRGEEIGVVNSVNKDRSGNLVFDYKPAGIINNGDGLFFVSASGEESGARAARAEGSRVFTNEDIQVEPGSIIYRNYNHLFEKELEANMPERVLMVNITLSHQDNVTKILAKCEDGRTVEFESKNQFTFASNIELARANILNQLGKKSENFKFEATIADASSIVFYPAAYLNGLRREAAKKLSLQKASTDNKKLISAHRKRDFSLTEVSLPVGFKSDYRLNSANKLSALLYKEIGATDVEPAYEVSKPDEAELMRTKYCIKFELGLCPKAVKNKAGRKTISEPLFLINQGKKFRIGFDCENCEMVIYG